jgi:hypothetical protein
MLDRLDLFSGEEGVVDFLERVLGNLWRHGEGYFNRFR